MSPHSTLQPDRHCGARAGGMPGSEDVMRLDLAYIEHWSLWLDFKILVKIIPAVFKARGAC